MNEKQATCEEEKKLWAAVLSLAISDLNKPEWDNDHKTASMWFKRRDNNTGSPAFICDAIGLPKSKLDRIVKGCASCQIDQIA